MNELRQVTAEEVKESVLSNKVIRIDHHTCALCNAWTHYSIFDGELFFDPSCNCTGDMPIERSWENLADFINSQTDAQTQQRILKACGFTIEEVTHA